MKNLTKFMTVTALVAFLALPTAFAHASPSVGDSDSSTHSSPSVGDSDDSSGPSHGPSVGDSDDSSGPSHGPSVGDSDDSSGNPSSGGSHGGSSRGSSSSRRSHGGSGYAYALTISDVAVTKVNDHTVSVTWKTVPAGSSLIVYGASSVKTPASNPFYGYTFGSETTPVNVAHTVLVNVTPGVTTYMRPVVFVGSRVLFGTELALTPPSSKAPVTVRSSARPVIGTQKSTSSTVAPTVEIEGNMPGTDMTGGVISKATTSVSNTAAAANAQSGSRIGNFFRYIWACLFAPVCK
jgi:hypothetical protein